MSNKRLPAFSCRARPGVDLSAEVARAARLALGRPHPAAERAAKREKRNRVLWRKQARRICLGWSVAPSLREEVSDRYYRRFFSKHGPVLMPVPKRKPRAAYGPIVKVEFLTA